MVDPQTGQKVPKPKPPKPDPEMAKVQQEGQLHAAKQHADEVALKAKWTLAEQDQLHRQQLAQQQAEFEARLADAKAARESQLAQEKMDRETMLAAQKIELDHSHRMATLDAKTDLPDNREGGDLSE